jgi:hypothetical protein
MFDIVYIILLYIFLYWLYIYMSVSELKDWNVMNLQAGSFLLLNTTNASDTQTGTLVISGGAGIAKDLYVGGSINSGANNMSSLAITGTGNSTSTSSGVMTVAGGVGIAKNVYIGGMLYSQITFPSQQLSTASLGGAIVQDLGTSFVYAMGGNMCMLKLPYLYATASGVNTSIFSAVGWIPSTYRNGTNAICIPQIVYSGSSSAVSNGFARIGADGQVIWYTNNGGNFSTSGNNGFPQALLLYHI